MRTLVIIGLLYGFPQVLSASAADFARAETAGESELPWERETSAPAAHEAIPPDTDRQKGAQSPAQEAGTPPADREPQARAKATTDGLLPWEREVGTQSAAPSSVPSIGAPVEAAADTGTPSPAAPELVTAPAHPTVAIIREKLADPNFTEGANEGDVGALRAFYEDWGEPPVWITEMGLSTKGQAVLFRGPAGGQAEGDRNPAADHQYGALALDAGRPRPAPCVAQHAGVHAVRDEGRREDLSGQDASGSSKYPTPIFSAHMDKVVFNPDWIAPPSVLRDKLWPALKRKQFDIIESNELLVSYNGRRIDPTRVDWRRVNIHNFVFKQKSGPKNVLGKAKFLYPNEHYVYMHDVVEESREKFGEKRRAVGYSCVRMAKPQAFAALMLAEDHGLPKGKVAQFWNKGVNKSVALGSRPPVHTTYFTVVADREGKVSTFKDLYGLDRKHAAAFFGSTNGFPLPPPEPKSRSRNVAATASTRGGGGLASSLGFAGN